MAVPDKDLLEGDKKRYGSIEGKTVIGNGCIIATARNCMFIGNNNKITTAKSCRIEGNGNNVTYATKCEFIGKNNTAKTRIECTFPEGEDDNSSGDEHTKPKSTVGRDGQRYLWRALINAETGESFADAKRKKLLKPLKESELPPRNPRTGARDWINASARMDELEDLARGRTKAVNTADMPAWAQVVHEAGGDAGVVDLDRVPAAAAAPPKPAGGGDCAICYERKATVAGTECGHAAVCGKCLANVLSYDRPSKCKSCGSKK